MANINVPLGGLGSLLGKSEGLTSVGGAGAAVAIIMNFPVPDSVLADEKAAAVVTIIQIVTTGLVLASSIMSYNASRGRAKAGEEGLKK